MARQARHCSYYREGALKTSMMEDERTGTMNKENIGSSFDDWLREEDIYEQTTAVVIKRVLARQIA